MGRGGPDRLEEHSGLRPQQALERSMSDARELRRRNQGFAAMCAVIRTSGTETIDRMIANILDDTPRATTAQVFVSSVRRWVRGTPRDALTGWVRKTGQGPGKAR